MGDKMNVSIVVVTYRRLQDMELILSGWLKETPDVWLCDCSKEGFKTNLPIKIIRAIPDPGSKIRHAVAMMTDGDLVIKADDDIVPQSGIVADFIQAHQQVDGITGIHARMFNGEDYYRQTKLVHRPLPGQQPIRVDFLGIITCAPRKYLAMDLKGCESPVEDLFWHNWAYPTAAKYIISTTKYTKLQSSKDPQRLCGNPEARIVRRAFYKKCYERFYKK
jgi:hypothetical protein